MRAQGVSREDVAKGLESVLRSVWPSPRGETWHFECEQCRDTGFEAFVCPTRPCASQKVRPCGAGVGYEHTYVVPCPCRAVNRTFKRRHEAEPEDVIGAAAQVGKGRR